MDGVSIAESILGSNIRSMVHVDDNVILRNYVHQILKQSGNQIMFDRILITRNLETKILARDEDYDFGYHAVGDFQGGEIQIMTKFYHVNNRMIVFNGNELHRYMALRGTKYGFLLYGRHISIRSLFTCEISVKILSRDLGLYNTLISWHNKKLNLPYKQKGIWALRIENDGNISNTVLLNTYFERRIVLTEWPNTLYTVSDTACAMGRPLHKEFYDAFRSQDLIVPVIEYRLPFVFFISKKYGNFSVIGHRRIPLSVMIQIQGDYMTVYSSQSRYSTPSVLSFD